MSTLAFQQLLVESRKAFHLSQSMLAHYLHVPVRTLQEWEQGRQIPANALRVRLALELRPEVLSRAFSPDSRKR